jgi:hypothetical protein
LLEQLIKAALADEPGKALEKAIGELPPPATAHAAAEAVH